MLGNHFDGASTYAGLELWGSGIDVSSGAPNDFTGFTGPVDIRSEHDDIHLNDATGADSATANDLAPAQPVALTGASSADTLTGNSADNVITGGGGNDTIAGNAGIDTAEYAQAISASMLASNGSGGWTVTTGGAGHRHAHRHRDRAGQRGRQVPAGRQRWLCHAFRRHGGRGERRHHQDRLRLDQHRDRDGRQVRHHPGCQCGISASSLSRGVESTLTGALRILAAGVVIDGLHVAEGATITGEIAGIFVQADHVTIENTVFTHSGTVDADGSRAILTASGSAADLSIHDNSMTGWATGTYLNPGAVNADVHDNNYDGNYVGLSVDSPNAVSVHDNIFHNNVFEHVGTGVTDTVEDLSTQIGDNTFSGGSTTEVGIYPLAGTAQTITGTEHADVFNATDNGNTFHGLDGNDILNGGAGNDTLDGGNGVDTVNGGSGNDLIVGNVDGVADHYDGGTNTVVDPVAGTGGDTVDYSATTLGISVSLTAGTVTSSEAGNDTLTGIENVIGGSGDDSLTGDGNANILIGNGGTDTLSGLGGNDLLVGGAQDDFLNGGAGNDVLIGGGGADMLTGGNDADQFVYQHQADGGTAAGGEDHIFTFSIAQGDKMVFNLSAATNFFDGVTLPGDFNDGGHVKADYFLVTDVSAGNTYGGPIGQPTFVLDTVVGGANGTLWFDANGDGSLTGPHDVKIATFDVSSSLAGISNHDLLLV